LLLGLDCPHKVRLTEAGLCEVVTAAMIAKADSPDVQKSCLFAMAFLTTGQDDNLLDMALCDARRRLGAAGA